MKKEFQARLDNARTLADIFEVVKDAVKDSMGTSRGGLMLGLANLGNDPQGFLGAFYPVGSNIIVMNKIPLERIKETDPQLYKPYTFHVMLHEYLHSLGYLDENMVRQQVYKICKNILGEEHAATRFAADTTSFFKNLVYPGAAWKADEMKLELVYDFDRSSTSYIA
jgi:hypothetical protein